MNREEKIRSFRVMSELEQRTKEELMAIVSLHYLTRLSDGLEELAIGREPIGMTEKDLLTKRLKGGWILSKDFDENHNIIARWEQMRENINTSRKEIKELEEAVEMTQKYIARIESGKWRALRRVLPTYRENLEEWQKSLVTKRQQLKEAKIKFKSLKASIKSLKDKFELYISKLEEKK